MPCPYHDRGRDPIGGVTKVAFAHPHRRPATRSPPLPLVADRNRRAGLSAPIRPAIAISSRLVYSLRDRSNRCVGLRSSVGLGSCRHGTARCVAVASALSYP